VSESKTKTSANHVPCPVGLKLRIFLKARLEEHMQLLGSKNLDGSSSDLLQNIVNKTHKKNLKNYLAALRRKF